MPKEAKSWSKLAVRKFKYLKINSTVSVLTMVVDDDSDQQDEDVLGHKPHVEHAARRQQHQPTPLVG